MRPPLHVKVALRPPFLRSIGVNPVHAVGNRNFRSCLDFPVSAPTDHVQFLRRQQLRQLRPRQIPAAFHIVQHLGHMNPPAADRPRRLVHRHPPRVQRPDQLRILHSR